MKKRRLLRLPTKLPPSAGNETAMQGIWSGTISFSLVAIPVQLVTALGPSRVSFRLLHSKDHSPLLRRMYCPKEEAIVPPDEIVRGYEIQPNKYVPITDEELESVAPERTRTIEIIQFIDMEEIDSIYYGHPYYLVPSKGGEKAYGLLVELMHRTNKAGFAKFVLGEREYLALIRSMQGALSLITLHYSEDIISDKGLVPKEEKIESEDKSRMKKIIKGMAGDFSPNKYADERRKKIMKFLEKKAREKGTVEAPELEEEEVEGPVDLVAVLERSMRKVKKKR
jgi:DNA end-binding protein Ku